MKFSRQHLENFSIPFLPIITQNKTPVDSSNPLTLNSSTPYPKNKTSAPPLFQAGAVRNTERFL